MPSKEVINPIHVTKWRVKYKDVFDMVQYYKALHEWLIEYEWTDLEDGEDHYENFYLEKIDMEGFKEIWIKWRPQKVPVKNAYYRYWMDFDFHCIAIKGTEIVKEGKKYKVHKGEVELWINVYIELDYKGEWSNHPILRFFNRLFPERIFRREIYEEHKRELYRESYELQNYIKQWFKLHRHAPYKEVPHFHNRGHSWPSHLKE